MSVLPSPNAQAARKALADRLRDLMRDAGLNGRQLAAGVGWHPSKVSRIANAITPPSDEDIRIWCAVCHADAQAADLIAANRAADSMYAYWRRIHRSGIRRIHEATMPLYDRTRSFRVYASNVVPGMLQTFDYAAALLQTITAFQGTPDDVQEAAAARVTRSQVIRRGDHRFALVIEEAVLRYRIGDDEVMTAQLGFLLEAMALPSVSFSVIPFGARRTMWPLEAFYIFDESEVQVETLSAQLTITAPGEISVYCDAFATLADIAVSGAAARALVTAAIVALDG